MTIRKKPITPEQETKINSIIQKGGSSSVSAAQSGEPYRLSLRIPVGLKLQVDELIASDPTEPSLTAWILEAMKQKLKREKQEE